MACDRASTNLRLSNFGTALKRLPSPCKPRALPGRRAVMTHSHLIEHWKRVARQRGGHARLERASVGGDGALIKEKPGSHGTANRVKKGAAMVSTIKGGRPINQFGARTIIVKPQ